MQEMDFPSIVKTMLNRTSLGRALLVLLLVWWLLIPRAAAQWHEFSGQAMGTRIHLELWHEESALARDALKAGMAEMRRIEAAYSPYQSDSELSVLNASAVAGWVPVSAELMHLLQLSRQMSELTKGAFDVTFASAGRYYDYRAKQAPDDKTLTSLLASIDYRFVELDAAARRVKYSQPQVYVDLGGIAKGYAVDQVIDQWRAMGIEQASVSAGGDSRILGDRRGYPWTVGVRHPRQAGELAVRLPLEDTAVSTSGDYERFFVRDGVRFHHILDPQTGKSAQGALSVTILGATAAYTDALSTSVFVLGAKAGMQLIDQLPDGNAIIISPNGEMTYSQGLVGPETAAR